MKRRQSFYFLQIFPIHRANGNVLIIVESLIFWEIHLNCCLDENDFNQIILQRTLEKYNGPHLSTFRGNFSLFPLPLIWSFSLSLFASLADQVFSMTFHFLQNQAETLSTVFIALSKSSELYFLVFFLYLTLRVLKVDGKP